MSRASRHFLDEEDEDDDDEDEEDDEKLPEEFKLAAVDAFAPEHEEIDREVEEFRLLLEKINAECNMRKRKKLVLPPGAFANMSVGTMC